MDGCVDVNRIWCAEKKFVGQRSEPRAMCEFIEKMRVDKTCRADAEEVLKKAQMCEQRQKIKQSEKAGEQDGGCARSQPPDTRREKDECPEAADEADTALPKGPPDIHADKQSKGKRQVRGDERENDASQGEGVVFHRLFLLSGVLESVRVCRREILKELRERVCEWGEVARRQHVDAVERQVGRRHR